jgi:2,4-dienoyl-CoA reductase-like NADH-dependent reductase (Old Yellow Enzyme family)
MSVLFEPIKIGGLEIKNRFMRSATTSYYSDEKGILRPEIIQLYEHLAKGGIGLIVKGHLYIHDKGKAHSGMAGISQDYHVPKIRELTEIVHKYDGLIAAQLNHGGINSMIERKGPSRYQGDGWVAGKLNDVEVWNIIESFGEAASRAVEAGFDAIQIHGAHGYLVSQFLSKHVNKRDDEWGGDLERRMRLLKEVYHEIRSRIPMEVPLMIKMNSDDFHPKGLNIDEATVIAEKISRMGMDLIEISGGGLGRWRELRKRAGSDDPEIIEAEFVGHAMKIRKVSKPKPLALVSGIRSKRTMEALIERDIADIISMSRPFIREPDLVKRMKQGQIMAGCSTCDACRGRDVFGKTMLRCQMD